MAEWIRIANVDDCPSGHAIEAVAGDRIVALFCVDGEYHALDGVCPHQGGPLGKGNLEGCVVTCPWHGWQFDVTTGAHQINQSVTQPSLPVKMEEGQVYVDVNHNSDLAKS